MTRLYNLETGQQYDTQIFDLQVPSQAQKQVETIEEQEPEKKSIVQRLAPIASNILGQSISTLLDAKDFLIQNTRDPKEIARIARENNISMVEASKLVETRGFEARNREVNIPNIPVIAPGGFQVGGRGRTFEGAPSRGKRQTEEVQSRFEAGSIDKKERNRLIARALTSATLETGLEVFSMVPAFGAARVGSAGIQAARAGNGLKILAGGGIIKGTLKASAPAAAWGGGFGLATGLGDPTKGVKEVFKEAAIGTGAGFGLGVAGTGVARVSGSIFKGVLTKKAQFLKNKVEKENLKGKLKTPSEFLATKDDIRFARKDDDFVAKDEDGNGITLSSQYNVKDKKFTVQFSNKASDTDAATFIGQYIQKRDPRVLSKFDDEIIALTGGHHRIEEDYAMAVKRVLLEKDAREVAPRLAADLQKKGLRLAGEEISETSVKTAQAQRKVNEDYNGVVDIEDGEFVVKQPRSKEQVKTKTTAKKKKQKKAEEKIDKDFKEAKSGKLVEDTSLKKRIAELESEGVKISDKYSPEELLREVKSDAVEMKKAIDYVDNNMSDAMDIALGVKTNTSKISDDLIGVVVMRNLKELGETDLLKRVLDVDILKGRTHARELRNRKINSEVIGKSVNDIYKMVMDTKLIAKFKSLGSKDILKAALSNQGVKGKKLEVAKNAHTELQDGLVQKVVDDKLDFSKVQSMIDSLICK